MTTTPAGKGPTPQIPAGPLPATTRSAVPTVVSPTGARPTASSGSDSLPAASGIQTASFPVTANQRDVTATGGIAREPVGATAASQAANQGTNPKESQAPVPAVPLTVNRVAAPADPAPATAAKPLPPKAEASAATEPALAAKTRRSEPALPAPASPDQIVNTGAVPLQENRSETTAPTPAADKTPVEAEIADPPALVQQIGERVAAAAPTGRQEITVQLEPETLGRLRLKLEMVEGVIRARILVENRTVQTILESRLPELRSALASQGIDCAPTEVLLMAEGRSAFRQPARQSYPRQRGRASQTEVRSEALSAAGDLTRYERGSTLNTMA